MKSAANINVGDREIPLEANPESDVTRNHPLIGKKVEVSPVAAGDFQAYIGKSLIVVGVILRLGELVGLEVLTGGSKTIGTLKDFYVKRDVLEDIQPPTATSISVKQCLHHYGTQRDYWLPMIDGIESFCFELATCAPFALIHTHQSGFTVNIPEPHGPDITSVVGTVVKHNNYYSMNTMCFPRRQNEDFDIIPPPRDHWWRTFAYTEVIVKGLIQYGFPWEKQLQELLERQHTTLYQLRPILGETLPRVLKAYEQVTGKTKPNVSLDGVSIGLSNVRLKPGTIGLNEPPTDRRPYTVISVGKEAFKNKDPNYLNQVILHECIHLVVANVRDLNPHNDLFIELSNMLGLDPEYQD